jgi:hypothetical protein
MARYPAAGPRRRDVFRHSPRRDSGLAFGLWGDVMMHRFCFLAMVICLALAGQTRAVDLGKIDRFLRKEPTYESKEPQYCLLVFGPEAKTRVWVVLDGDILYLDRNANGDLTDSGERISAQEVYRNLEERPDVKLMRRFELKCWKEGEEPILTCGPEIQWFYLLQVMPRADWHDQTWVKSQQERPFDFAVTTKTGHGQRAMLHFATSPEDAPILHFDGPRRFALSDKFGAHHFRPGEPCDLAVELHTQGLNATVRTELFEVPENVHPVAEIEFPPGRAGGAPIRRRVELKQRC